MNGGLSMVEMKSGYKMTEVGVIPEDWEVKELGDITKDMSDGPFGSNLKSCHYTNNKEVRIIQLSNIGTDGWSDNNRKYTTYKHLDTIRRCEVKSGNLVIAKMMPAGRAIICPSTDAAYVLSSDAVRVNLLECVNNDYAFYCTKSGYYLSQIAENTQGSTRARTSIKKLRNILFCMPDVKEQVAIAAALSDVDSLISALTKKIEKKKAIKQGLMQQLLTGKKRLPGYKGLALVKNEKMEYPGDWDVVKLGDLCRIITKQTGFDYSATIKPSLRTSRGLGVLPFIQNKDFEGYKINFNTDFYIPKNVAMQFPQILLDEPSLLVSISGRIGNVGYYLSSKLAFIGGAICVAKFWKKEYIPWVMLYLQSSKGQNEIFMNEKAGAQHNITVEAIRNFRIPMPSMSEQTAIANILSDCDSEIAALEEKRDKYKEIKQGMMQQLLTGKIRLIK